MNLDNNISVIIPVFNAAEFVVKAVESALIQPETKEIILVEDGSKDTSLQVCKELASKYDIVKLYIHPGNCNKGAGASRNLGIKEASGDYIAFLDADDYYLPNRFREERKIFLEKPETDGVYGALGFHYYSKEGEEKYKQQGFKELTTLPGKVAPNELFLSLLWLHEKVNGYFSVDTLTIKKNVFVKKTEMFNNLKLHEDTVFIIQLAMTCKLEAGSIEDPLAMRGVHDNNRIVNRPAKSRRLILQWDALYKWSKKTQQNSHMIRLFKNSMIKEKILYSNKMRGFFLLFFEILYNRSFTSDHKFFNESCIKIFGSRKAWYIINLKNKISRKFKIGTNK